jgi:DNA-binding SARP family transcriptional activator/ABC-type branched-subunit amino acid transport system substrate-binding protein
MEFGILGPLEVSESGRVIALGGGKQRALLAVLLLRRNEVVSTDRLIEDLWSGRPPATALKIVQLYVSQLRKALGEGVLVTRAPGYLLAVGPGQLDADRAGRLLEEARGALAAGDAAAASDSLREALALWRGPVLSDFAYDEFAQSEIGRLGALRIDTVEERIEADLALGRHADLVPELTVLVGEQPLRERLRAQLMLALYRCGRQADALAVHRDARRVLDEELGLAPGKALQELERRILQHDAALEAPRRVEASPQPGRRAAALPSRLRRRGPALLLAGAVLLGAGVAALAFDLTRGGGSAAPGAQSFVVAINPKTNRIAARIPVGTQPTSIAVGAGSVWAINAGDQTVARIDPATRALVATISTGGTPTDLAAGDGAAWVGRGEQTGGSASMVGAEVTGSVSRVDLLNNRVSQTVAFARRATASNSAEPFPGATQMAVGPTGVWVVDPDETLSRFDPHLNRVVATVRGVTAEAVAVGREGVWIDDGAHTVAQIDPRRNKVSYRTRLPGGNLSGIAVGARSVWVVDGVDGMLWRIGAGREHVPLTIHVGVGASAVAFGAGAIWVTNWLQGTLLRIDPRSNSVSKTIPLPGTPQSVVVGDSEVWVTVSAGGTGGAGTSRRVDGVSPVVASTCGPIDYGGTSKLQYLIGSDLPLQGPSRTTTIPMTQAIQLVLGENHFRAGRYAVGYQSCDDSTAQVGDDDLATCAGNAKAYGATTALLGVIGTYNSDCASVEVPIANRAGGLAMISATNTYAGLTHGGPGTLPGEPGVYSPSGRRSFVRITSPDDVEAAAQALLAHELGLTRVAVLSDGDEYARILLAGFTRAAKAVDLEIVGPAHWDPNAKSYAALAGRVAAWHPDAIFFAGYGDGKLLRDLRGRLGKNVQFLAPSGFLEVPFIEKSAGAAADGLLISYPGVPDALLPASGRRFAEAFGRTQPGGVVLSYGAVYAAQATEALLAAIGRSNGTRASVTRQLLRTRVRHGILGSFGFNRNGDIEPAPITFFRVVGGTRKNSTLIDDFDGSVIDRVIVVPAKLVR